MGFSHSVLDKWVNAETDEGCYSVDPGEGAHGSPRDCSKLLKQQKKVSSVGSESRYLKEATPETGIACTMHCSHVPVIPTGKELERDKVGLREKQSCDVG